MLEMIELQFLDPSPRQLRSEICDLEELMDSIRQKGLLQPIIVRPRKEHFEIVAGNRRYEACRKLRWRLIPCIVRELTDKEAYEFSILENVQRDSLALIDEAEAYRAYTERYGWGSISELAQKIGKSETHISHCISILKLPYEILNKIRTGELNRSAALELLWINDEDLRAKLLDMNSVKKLTVKEIRSLAREENRKDTSKGNEKEPFSSSWIKDGHSREYRILEKTALSLRIALLRLDSLIERTEEQPLRGYLMEKRFELHEMIDEIIAKKKTLHEY
jgi:ParB family transcriptional regulator, chromosome partitioning protein